MTDFASLPDANQPFAPFQTAVPIPTVAWNADPLVHVCLNETWATYVIGALQCLCVASTWASMDENAVRSAIENAQAIVNSLMEFEACPVAVEFRVNPDNNYYWDYSVDGGATWTRQPDTVINYQINWATDGTSPSNLKATINAGQTYTVLPKPIGEDPDAVVTDPLTALVNTIAPATGIPGMLIKALNDFALYLESNNISLHLAKGSDRGTPDGSAVFEVDAPNSYDYPLLITNT